MKALSIRQPFAWLIVQGIQPIENRTWRTAVRGPILIHAGQKFDRPSWHVLWRTHPEILWPKTLEFGGIIGQAELVDCVHTSDSPWWYGPYGFVLQNARPLPFRRYKGQLGFFEVEELSGTPPAPGSRPEQALTDPLTIDPATIDSAVLRRLIEELQQDAPTSETHAYDRVHNRHNRGPSRQPSPWPPPRPVPRPAPTPAPDPTPSPDPTGEAQAATLEVVWLGEHLHDERRARPPGGG